MLNFFVYFRVTPNAFWKCAKRPLGQVISIVIVWLLLVFSYLHFGCCYVCLSVLASFFPGLSYMALRDSAFSHFNRTLICDRWIDTIAYTMLA